MEIKRKSYFKQPAQDKAWFEHWVVQLERLNHKQYKRIGIDTSLGYTHIWGLNTEREDWETLVIFPGARTSALFWDFNNGLQPLENNFRIFLVETNGLPNLSDGNTPDIKTLDYGEWAVEVLNQLSVTKAFLAGASFGGLICMKLCLVAASRVKAVFLLNPGCLQPFSLSLPNLYYNLLPICFPTRQNVALYLEKAIFYPPVHHLPAPWENLLIEYELFALKRYQDHTQKPYYMGGELAKVPTDTYLIIGDKDLLFPYKKSIENAQNTLPSLQEVVVLPNVGHGIETYPTALQLIADKARN